MRFTHPDKNKDPEATKAFTRVGDAAITLTDPEERAKYDRELVQSKQTKSHIQWEKVSISEKNGRRWN
eukprot:CAMPEP_0185789696 /NCGR_PEP_ID=MMETSP1174-20130828/152414_1 /TAXON_ID=35687 /ORGANISM="Dictyocha speculum, Strain CCMP1381" /LENGTH=67 /DNA_ID=CAMNT_0028483965 /DNA_START=30 /DNA_END=230 /DNA_ORIENTATION=-